MHTIRREKLVTAMASLVLAAAMIVPVLHAQQTDPLQAPANPSPLYVATFVDLLPPNLAEGTAAIRQYVQDTRKDPGNRRCEAIAQVAGRANHLIVIEVWQDRAAFLAHEGAAHTIAYRAKMLPLIGAPFDQREHFLLP